MTGGAPWRIEADWRAPPRVRALTTTRRGPGVSAPPFDAFNLGGHVGEPPQATATNRRRLADALALPASPRWLDQVHGSAVHDADGARADAGADPRADAAVTRAPGTVLAVLTADCLPVVLATGDGRAIAVAHAGWRGLAAGVIEAALTALHAPHGSVRAWLGPAIGPDSYEVGAEVREALLAADPGGGNAFRATRPGHWLCDLYALARRRLSTAGVTDVAGGTHCTLRERDLYSYRRDGTTGRMATLAWIEP